MVCAAPAHLDVHLLHIGFPNQQGVLVGDFSGFSPAFFPCEPAFQAHRFDALNDRSPAAAGVISDGLMTGKNLIAAILQSKQHGFFNRR